MQPQNLFKRQDILFIATFTYIFKIYMKCYYSSKHSRDCLSFFFVCFFNQLYVRLNTLEAKSFLWEQIPIAFPMEFGEPESKHEVTEEPRYNLVITAVFVNLRLCR